VDVLNITVWALSGVAICCWLIMKRARAEIGRVNANARLEITYWKTEAARAKITAAQLKLEIDAWKAGHAQGRKDVINALPLLAVRHDPAIGDPAACGCQPTAQISNSV
jgi:hypothetical protein